MGLKISISEMSSRISSINAKLRNINSDISKITINTKSYISEGKLSGKAYNNSKSYLEKMYLPILNSVMLANQSIISSNNSFVGLFNSYVDNPEGFETDTDILEEMIAKLEQQNISYENQLSKLSFFGNVGEFLSNINPWKDSIKEKIKLNIEKIKKIKKVIKGMYDFNSNCAGIYEESCNIIDYINKGLNDIEFNNWDNKTSMFNMSFVEKDWLKFLKTINRKFLNISSMDILKEMMKKPLDQLSEEELISMANYLISLSSEEDINSFILAGYTQKLVDGNDRYFVCSDTYKSVIMIAQMQLISDYAVTNIISQNKYISEMMKLELIKLKSKQTYVPSLYERGIYNTTFDCKIHIDLTDLGKVNTNYSNSWMLEENYTNMLYPKFEWEATTRYFGCGSTANINKDFSINFDFSPTSDKAKQLLANIAKDAGLTLATAKSSLSFSVATSVLLGLPDIKTNPNLNNQDLINDMKLFVIETEKLKDGQFDAKDMFGRSNTEKHYTIFPSKDTFNELDRINKEIDNINNKYVINHKPIPLRGNTLSGFMNIDVQNPLYKFNINADNTVSLVNIKNIQMIDILTNPNLSNELYCLVQQLKD